MVEVHRAVRSEEWREGYEYGIEAMKGELAPEIARLRAEVERLTAQSASSSCCQEDDHACGPLVDLERENEKLRASLKECADDLEVEINARVKDSAGMIHPALQRRYDRDIAPVVTARALLNE